MKIISDVVLQKQVRRIVKENEIWISNKKTGMK